MGKVSTRESESALPMFLLALGYAPFLMSAFQYQSFYWFPWLIGSRALVLLLSTTFAILVALNRVAKPNICPKLLTLAMVIQASHGWLEPAGKSEFYSFTGILFLVACLSYQGSRKTWIQYYFPIQVLALIVPIFAKDSSLIFPVSRFIDSFSLTIASLALGIIVININARAFAAHQTSLALRDELLEEKQNAIHRQKSWSDYLEKELDRLRSEVSQETELKALGKLASQVAHDIRSPLAALEVVQKELKSLPEDQRLLLKNALNRIRDIANDLLMKKAQTKEQLARLENEEDDPKIPRPKIDFILPSIESVVSEKRIQARPINGVTLDYTMSAKCYQAFALVEISAFRRVLSNLVDNAIEALDANQGSVTVSISSEDEQLEIQIKDTGIGMSHEVLAQAGQDGFTHGKKTGHGLGLSYAKSKIEEWGGQLRIKSQPGQGTTVSFQLPRSPAPAWFAPKISIPSGHAIVVIDDDAAVHNIWSQRLTSATSPLVQISHLSNPDSVKDWRDENSAKIFRSTFLVDFEFQGSEKTGIDVITENGLLGRAFLVTSHFDDEGLRTKCEKLGLQIVPKGLAGLIPIEVT